MKMWEEAKIHDPNFGTNQHCAYCDKEADVKIRVAYEKKILNPFASIHTKEEYETLVQLVQFFLGCYFCVHGGKELSGIVWRQWTWGVYETGPDKG